MQSRIANKQILYTNRDITTDVTPYLRSLEYEDNVHGKADTIDISFDDSDMIWQTTWYPEMGAKLQVKIGYDTLVDCGVFEIDEIDFSANPDTVTIRAISAPVSKALRTKRSQGYEKQTLSRVVNQIARRHSLTQLGTIIDVSFDRITQRKESDLTFLSRLATQYGHVFSVRGTIMVFDSIYDLEAKNPVGVLGRAEIASFNVRDKLTQVFKKSRSRYHNPKNGQFVSSEQEGNAESADDYEVWIKTEDAQQAESVAKAKLHGKNSFKAEGSLTVEGTPFVLAGNNIQINGFGKLSGVYHIVSSHHSISDRGYSTSAQIKKVQEVSADDQKPSILRNKFDFVK
jgi:phage protein D